MPYTSYLHSNWEFVEDTWLGEEHRVGVIKAGWLPAQVPGHVHLDLVENGVIADPFVGMNELGCQWVDERNWRYRTTFEFQPNETLPKRVLRFEGLDTIATIFLNGEEIGQSRNMFVPLELDLSERLKTGRNEFEVLFTSAVVEGNRLRAEYLAAEGMADNIRNFDDRAFVRKAQYMFGWDWGPRLVSCGIWKPVSLIEYSSRILDIQATQEWHDDGSVTVRLSAEMEGPGTLTFSLSEPHRYHEALGHNVPVGPEEDVQRIGDSEFLVRNPVRWQPLQAGSQAFYYAHVHIDRGPIDPEQWEDNSRGIAIGLRSVKLLREPDQFGESFEFEVNGRRIWARGANWIPDHSFPSLVNERRYRERLEQAKELGCNMLRVWGGGLYEADEFYELCDELGILVWQDFPFACSYYPESDEFKAEITNEALTNIKRLRNHPSLALWCGNNENQMMWFDKWGGKDRSPSRHYGLELYRNTIPSVLAEADPSRPYIETSPVVGTKDSDEVNPNLGGSGDQHYWDVWHGRGDWRHYEDSTARFSSEYGFASSCAASTWKNVLSGDETPESPTVRWHDKTGKGWDKFSGMVELHYPKSKSLEDWIYYSQLNQRDAIRFGLEHYRRSEFCKGSLIWQLNDCWPVQSWALIDFEGNRKAAAYELQRLHEDQMCSLVRDKDRFELWTINDSNEEWHEIFEIEVFELSTGECLRRESAVESIAPHTRCKVFELSIAGLSVPDLLIVGGYPGVETWQLAAEPKSAKLAPPGPITVSTHVEGSLQIRVDRPVVDLRLTSNGSTLPFGSNFLTMTDSWFDYVQLTAPIETLEARSLAGIHPVKLVRGPLF